MAGFLGVEVVQPVAIDDRRSERPPCRVERRLAVLPFRRFVRLRTDQAGQPGVVPQFQQKPHQVAALGHRQARRQPLGHQRPQRLLLFHLGLGNHRECPQRGIAQRQLGRRLGVAISLVDLAVPCFHHPRGVFLGNIPRRPEQAFHNLGGFPAASHIAQVGPRLPPRLTHPVTRQARQVRRPEQHRSPRGDSPGPGLGDHSLHQFWRVLGASPARFADRIQAGDRSLARPCPSLPRPVTGSRRIPRRRSRGEFRPEPGPSQQGQQSQPPGRSPHPALHGVAIQW